VVEEPKVEPVLPKPEPIKEPEPEKQKVEVKPDPVPVVEEPKIVEPPVKEVEVAAAKVGKEVVTETKWREWSWEDCLAQLKGENKLFALLRQGQMLCNE
jgi:hypothetical protein